MVKDKLRAWFTVSVLVLAACNVDQAGVKAEPSLVLLNGRVYTANGERDIHQGINVEQEAEN